MPRPNQPRSLMGEAELAHRIAMERTGRGWTYEQLAARMTDAGCSIQASAIFKIEKGDPPRRITVDELIGLSAAFELAIQDLLLPREVVADKRMRHLFERWNEAREAAAKAEKASREAFAKLARFVQDNHDDALERFYDLASEWASIESGDELERDYLQAMLVAKAVPVEAFKERELAALVALAEKVKEAEKDG